MFELWLQSWMILPPVTEQYSVFVFFFFFCLLHKVAPEDTMYKTDSYNDLDLNVNHTNSEDPQIKDY